MTYPTTPRGDVVDDYRHPGARSLSLDGGSRRPATRRMGGRAERGHRGVPRRRCRCAQHFTDRLTELWNYPRISLPVDRKRPAVLREEQRPAAPGADLHARRHLRSAVARARSEHALAGRLDLAGAVRAIARCEAASPMRCREGRRRLGDDRVRDFATGEDLADDVPGCASRICRGRTTRRGFFYSRYPEPPKHKVLEAALSGQAIYYHRVGTPQADDVLIYQRQDHPGWIVNGPVTEDGRYLFIRMAEGADNNNQLHYIDLGNAGRARHLGAGAADCRNRRCRIHADWQLPDRCSICAPTRTRRIAASSRSTSSIAERDRRGRPWLPSSRTRSNTSRSSAAASSSQYLVDVQSRLQDVRARRRRPRATIALPGIGAVAGLDGPRGRAGRLVPVQLAADAVHGLSLRSRGAGTHAVRGADPPVDATPVRNAARCSRRRRTARACRSS